MKCLNRGCEEYEFDDAEMVWECPHCGDGLTDVQYAKIEAMQAERDAWQSLDGINWYERAIEAEKAIEAMQAVIDSRQWTLWAECPCEDTSCIAYLEDYGVFEAECIEDEYGDWLWFMVRGEEIGRDPTHWMPLPKRPNCTTPQPCGLCPKCKGGNDASN